MSSEIRDRVERILDAIILEAIESYMCDWDEAIDEAKTKILSIPEIAIVDREASLPVPKLPKRMPETSESCEVCQLLTEKRTFFAMLDEGWVKEEK